MSNLKLVVDNSDKTETRENRFSGESIQLTKKEADIHDSIFYYEYLASLEDLPPSASSSFVSWPPHYWESHNACCSNPQHSPLT